METAKIINRLKELDLSTFPNKETESLLKQLFSVPIPIITTDYAYPKEFERAVNNTNDEPIFNSKNRISYKPAQCNDTFQRASTPKTTMFYASVILEKDLSDEEIKYARITGAYETVDLLREDINGERIVTFGKWQAQGLISVTTIFDPNIDYKINYINTVRDFCKEQKLSEKEIFQRDEVLIFLAGEFSKKITKGENYNYLISAIVTQLIVNHNSDGVLYPSVQSDGYGLCVALHPRVMDRLKLTKVLQCRIIKEDGSVEINNEKVCLIENDLDIFELKDI